MILIADSGSTKTEWCLIERTGSKTYFSTEGYNPYFVDSGYIVNSLMGSTIPVQELQDMAEINFYGAGCQADKVAVMEAALKTLFPSAKVFVEVDLLATARALLGREAGFAAILGTGTNTCTYDGNDITQNIDSLGFVLGDEGSGGFITLVLILPTLLYTFLAELLFGGQTVGKRLLQIKVVSLDGVEPSICCASFSGFMNGGL